MLLGCRRGRSEKAPSYLNVNDPFRSIRFWGNGTGFRRIGSVGLLLAGEVGDVEDGGVVEWREEELKLESRFDVWSRIDCDNRRIEEVSEAAWLSLKMSEGV